MRKIIIAIVVMLICIVLSGTFAVKLFLGYTNPSVKTEDTPKKLEASETTITVGSAGDIILHRPFIATGVYKSGSDYDFSSCFNYIKGNYEENDFMVANLETTLAGKARGYSGYPVFNSPEVIANNLTEAGVDLLLLANNHIYDTGKAGFLNTSKTLEEKNILYTGIRASSEEKPYVIEDINGIKVGFINYTYETPYNGGKAVNANKVDSSIEEYLNSFDPSHLEEFYTEFQRQYDSMRADGAEFIIFYPHWGEEYHLDENKYQNDMAQRLCDMGVDAIVGGHPHVVQPVDVFTSSSGTHKMFCAFSMGNQLSNQRRAYVPLTTGNTEDGIIVNLSITKDTDGNVKLTGVECIPTWVYLTGGKYYVLPANNPDTVEEETGLKGIKSSVQESYNRTHKIIDEGMNKVNQEFNK